MPTPTLTVRISPEHHGLLREIATRLKADASLPGRLRATMEAAPEPVPHPVQQPVGQGHEADVVGRLADLEDRVLALEERRSGRPRKRPVRKPTDDEKARMRAFATEVKSVAQSQGVPVTELAKRVAAQMNRAEKGVLAYLYGERPMSATTAATIRTTLGMPHASANVHNRT